MDYENNTSCLCVSPFTNDHFCHNFKQPPQVAFHDNIASVSALSFTDQDADAEEIGGRSGGAGALPERWGVAQGGKALISTPLKF